MKIQLRVDQQPASSLNLCFDKGRKNQAGRYAPRPWYEIEITARTAECRHSCYPSSEPVAKGKKSRHGKFNAYMKKGRSVFRLEMVVASDNGKALMSSRASGGRETLGAFIKGKLEDAGVLKQGERITSDILDAYGRDYVTLKKIGKQDFILEF